MKKFILITLSLTLLAFTVGDNRSEYDLPLAIYSINASDIDLDGDIDIITGHNYNSESEWSGLTLMKNDNGFFSLFDTINIYGGQTNVMIEKLNNDEYFDLIGQYFDGEQSNIAVLLYDNGAYNMSYFPMGNNISYYTSGDINGDSSSDVVFISNNDFLWGIIYNDGTGNFSEPQYFDLDYPPLDIACADLNKDGKDDIIIGADRVEVYFSSESGFEQQLLGYVLPLSGLGGHVISISDFDNDNDMDVLYYATHNSNNGVEYIYENLGNNNFYEHPYFEFTPFCSYAQIADFNNDSLPDMVFVGHDGEGLYIYRNIGDFNLEFDQFIAVDNYGAILRKNYCADFDQNGFNDIALIKYLHVQIPNNLQILFNDGKGNFQDDPITGKETQNSKLKAQNLSCYPNPFSTKTNISFNMDKTEFAQLQIFDIGGKLTTTMVDKKLQAGKYKYILSGNDLNMAGVYLVRLQLGSPNGKRAGGKVYMQRIVFIK